MTNQKVDSEVTEKPTGVNPGFVSFQIAKALTTSQKHNDPAIRMRALEKVAKWKSIFRNLLDGTTSHGSRTPVEAVPAWATLEVMTGGFATGELLAGGPLQTHELQLLSRFSHVPKGEERRFLNTYFLSEDGLKELQACLHSGCYEVRIPEEGSLLVIAWLVENGHSDIARDILTAITPFLSVLRFYPLPLQQSRRVGTKVHLQDVGTTIANLQKITPNRNILAQKEAVEVWLPLYDRMVALFLETVDGDWPCRVFPADWQQRARRLLGEYVTAQNANQLCARPARSKGHFAQLRELLIKCAEDSKLLTGREVGRIRLIVNRYVQKRGLPDSVGCSSARQRQLRDVSSPTFHSIAGVVVGRLSERAKDDGLDSLDDLQQAITDQESAAYGVSQGTPIPESIRKKVERSLNESIEVLVERGLITSGETLARVLPQRTSGIRAKGIAATDLASLYAAIYRAFRNRRSLLLLNLEKQVQIEELPWVQAIERFRDQGHTNSGAAKQALADTALLAFASFPYAILPNKLLQELRAMATSAELDIPLVEELAADIFMGDFSGKFVDATIAAANLLDGTLYASYFDIDYSAFKRAFASIDLATQKTKAFAQLCAERAGVQIGTWRPATNGMLIEQQQILTTQNLAVLFSSLGLVDISKSRLNAMAEQCFIWICQRQQIKVDSRHTKLTVLKNTAYAWRQMVFFLSLMPAGPVAEFLSWAEDYLGLQYADFQARFRPVLIGLSLAAEGHSIDSAMGKQAGAIQFLGWSDSGHFLLSTEDRA